MAHPRRLIAVGLATLIAGLIVSFPARVAYEWFAPDELKLSGISGSVWRGAATHGSASGVYLANVRWNFQPRGLLAGKIAFRMRSDAASGYLRGEFDFAAGGDVSMSDLDAQVSLADLAGAVPLSGIEGHMSLQFEELVLRNGLPVSAIGSVEVANLVSRYLSPATLGDYRATFDTDDEGILGTVEALSGVLELAGNIRLRPDRHYQFTGRVRAKPGAPAAITQQLAFLGSPDANGHREFRVEGRL